MIAVHIQGLQDGVFPIDVVVSTTEVPALAQDFIDVVRLHGTVARSGGRFTVQCTVYATARLECDRSLVEFLEPITMTVEQTFEIDNARAINLDSNVPWDPDIFIPIRDDAKIIDMTDVIRQELLVRIPMRKVAPQFRDKEMHEIFPNLSDEEAKSDDQVPDATWLALQTLKRN